ncbi:MAG: hypothetical protein [Olavius algarvensis Gamma 1 endosymbiont]|nr:MAG: hypothetical protein [Olavius algarvensis Gamma 1 endosymbiont]
MTFIILGSDCGPFPRDLSYGSSKDRPAIPPRHAGFLAITPLQINVNSPRTPSRKIGLYSPCREGGCRAELGKMKTARGDLPLGARASRPHRVSAVASGTLLAFLILRGLPQAGRMPALPAYRAPGTPPSKLPRSAICVLGPGKGFGHEMDFQFSPKCTRSCAAPKRLPF